MTDIVLILDAFELEGAAIDLGRSWLKERGIKVHYFIFWFGWFESMHKFGLLSSDFFEVMSDYIKNIKEWQGNEEKWKWFEELKVKHNRRFV